MSITLAIVVAFVLGRASSLPEADAATWVTAAATAVLAGFGLFQVSREIRRDSDRKAAARLNLEGAAWLARRTCEDTLHLAERIELGYDWARHVGQSVRLDPLQQYFREVLVFAGEAGKEEAETARVALEAFLAAADRVNMSAAEATAISLAEHETLCSEAVGYFAEAVLQLELFAPRREHEPPFVPIEGKPPSASPTEVASKDVAELPEQP